MTWAALNDYQKDRKKPVRESRFGNERWKELDFAEKLWHKYHGDKALQKAELDTY